MKKTSIIPKEAMPAVLAFRKPYDAYQVKRKAMLAQIGALTQEVATLDEKTQPKLKRLYSAIGDALGVSLDDGKFAVDSSYAVEHNMAFLAEIEDGGSSEEEDDGVADDDDDGDHTVH